MSGSHLSFSVHIFPRYELMFTPIRHTPIYLAFNHHVRPRVRVFCHDRAGVSASDSDV